MSGFRRYTVSADAVEDGVRLGFEGDVETEIAEMARNAAIITYPGANRRFHEYVLNIENGLVTAVMLLDEEKHRQAEAEKLKAKKRARRQRRKRAGKE